jgi:two-component system, NtrC family, sensor kinase
MSSQPRPLAGELTVAADDTQVDDDTESHLPRRILLIDDNAAIHEDFRKILAPRRPSATALDTIEVDLFAEVNPAAKGPVFAIDAAIQGKEGVEMVRDAGERPYALAFVDIRMPPGWDGIETIGRLWEEDPELQVVICSAFSDYSWTDIVARLNPGDRLLVLRKPFDAVEVRQMAYALTCKWLLHRQQRRALNRMKGTVHRRTRELVAKTEALRQQSQDRERLERELELTPKLENIGALASVVANTPEDPMRAVADGVQTLRLAFGELGLILARHRKIMRKLGDLPVRLPDGLRAEIADVQTQADQAMQQTVPEVLHRLTKSTAPVAALVSALREAVKR